MCGRLWGAAVGVLACACALVFVSAALGQEVSAKLRTSFAPDVLGASTTIGFSFQVRTAGGLAPPPLTALDLRMPKGMGYISTTLGLAECSRQTLENGGEGACPVNSRLGSGSAFVEVPFGKGAGRELPAINAYMAPSKNDNIAILFYVNGKSPVNGQFIFEAEILPQAGAFGSQLTAMVPIVPSVTGGPNVSIVSASASIGPKGLTYYKRVHGKRVAFKPQGIAIPEHCPNGGFPFSAQFAFMGGAKAQAKTTVPCPKSHPRR